MGYPKKNKAGLHKRVSSVLKGVRIPQGVHNWRPPDVSGLDWTGDSSEIPKSTISSVFEGLSLLDAKDFPRPTREGARAYPANTTSVRTPEGDQSSHTSMAKNPNDPEESSVDGLWTEQSESRSRIAYYRDPYEEPPRRSLKRWLREKLFGVNE